MLFARLSLLLVLKTEVEPSEGAEHVEAGTLKADDQPAAKTAALYSRRTSLYVRLTRLIGYPKGLERIFATEMSDALKPGARIMDAGCGAGAATFALLAAFVRLCAPRGGVDGFDLTPAMLSHFAEELSRRGIADVRLREADVLDLASSLPADWTNYDLIVTSAMLEYLPRDRVADALAALRGRLAPHGRLLFFISKKGAFNRWAMERWWHANCYDRSEIELAVSSAGFRMVKFHRFPAPYAFLNSWGHAVEAG